MSIPNPFPNDAQTQDAPTTVDAAEQQRLALLELEDSETTELTRRWIQVEERLTPAIRSVVDEIIRQREAGKQLTRDDILAFQQMAALNAVANDEFDSAIDDLAPTIHAHEQKAIENGAIAARVLIAAVAIDMGRRARVSIDDLEMQTLQNFIFGLQDFNSTLRILKGEQFSPLGMISDVVASGAIAGFSQEAMVKSFVYEGITQTLAYFSLLMRDLLATRQRNAMQWIYTHTKPQQVGLDPDKLANTDLIQVGRDIILTQRNKQATDPAEQNIVIGWRRRSRRDFRVCMVCIALDGKIYPTEALMEQHPNERCFMVPILRGMPIPDWQNGREWFLEQPENVQIELMGRGRYELWKDGLVDFDDFVESTGHQKWGPGVKVRALKDMQPIADTRAGPAGTRRGGRRTRANKQPATDQAAFGKQTDKAQGTRDLNPELPFPMTDDLIVRQPERKSALPTSFPTDDEIANAARIKLGNTGVNTSYAIEVNGNKYFVKKAGALQSRAEVLNYELADMLGLGGRVPPTRVVVFPDGSTGVIAEFAEGAQPIGAFMSKQQRDFWNAMSKEDRARFQMMEYLNGNTDRHVMNFMINPNTNDFYIIDSGASFGIDPFEHDYAREYIRNAADLNIPSATYSVPGWDKNKVNKSLIQLILDRGGDITDLLQAQNPNYGPNTFTDKSVDGMNRRLRMLQKVVDHMNAFDLDELSFRELQELIDQFKGTIR